MTKKGTMTKTKQTTKNQLFDENTPTFFVCAMFGVCVCVKLRRTTKYTLYSFSLSLKLFCVCVLFFFFSSSSSPIDDNNDDKK